MSRKFLTPPALPYGTQNPSVGTIGALFFRSDLQLIHVYTGSAWTPISAGGGISGSGDVDGGYVGDGTNLLGGQASTTSFTSTIDGGLPGSSSFTTTYSGGAA